MGEDEFEVDTEGELGERKTKKMHNPKMPTRTKIEEHILTHLPFRSMVPSLRSRAGEGVAAQACRGARRDAGTPCGHVLLGRGEGSAQHDHGDGGQGTEYQDDDGHSCASEECEIVYNKEACRVHEGGGYPTR